MTNQTDVKIHSIFPIPVYVATSDSDLISKEEIEKVIQQGMQKNDGNSYTKNTYVFNENLKEIKEFCEHHIKTYYNIIMLPLCQISLKGGSGTCHIHNAYI